MASFAQVVAAVAPVYSIHPYTFSERGTNEVYNCMIRCAFPRDESLDAISSDNVAKLNNMPWRQLDFQTLSELFATDFD